MAHMSDELVLTPGGHLFVRAGEAPGAGACDAWMRRVADAFSSCQAEGLFALAATKPDCAVPPSFSFWRDFASLYLTHICRTPDVAGNRLDPVKPPGSTELETFLLNAPPMQGGEYLEDGMLRGLWIHLDSWAREEVASFGEGLAGWLKARAPVWRQVGRVCFHLAENKNDHEFPFAFLATYAPGLSRGGRVQYRPLHKALEEYAGERNKTALVRLLSPLHLASEKSDFIQDLLESRDVFHPLAWTPGDAYRFLKDVPILEESGLLVRLPDWWRKRPRPRVAVTIGETKQRRFGADTMLDFRIELALGDETLTDEEWRQIMSADEGLVHLKGQWVEIDSEKLSQALEHWENVASQASETGISFVEGMRLLAGAPANLDGEDASMSEALEWSFVNAGDWLREILSGLRDPKQLTACGPPKGFHGTLREYQETGHNWLWFLSNLGLGACLADDMGLGKTIQVLSLLLALKETKKRGAKPSLLVLPASLLANWKAEIQRFAPSIETLSVHPSEMGRADLAAMARNPKKALSGIDLTITTYGMLLRQKWMTDLKWRLVILDEAQAIKNPAARQTKCVKKLAADARIALTGTPVENRLSDLWSLFDFLCPGLLGSAGTFRKFLKGLESAGHDRYAPLRNLVRPYILRRLKTDKSIIADLPDKTEMKVFCGLTKRQATLYGKSVGELSRALDGLNGMKRRGLVLSHLLRFKQICNHPSQLLGDGAYDATDSGKFDRLRAICDEIASRQEKVLVFTQFREVTEPIAAFLADVFGRQGLILHGGTSVKKRKTLIDAFQQEAGPPFFVLSLKAGGTGLNLTAASHVIHFDRWWNPAVENQATDRAFRIGQLRNVVVHKFICRGTVEEKIDALIEEKSQLASDILQGGAETLLTEMTDEQLLEVVALDIDRARM